ncbi:MAG: 4-hydroxy-tetrahydrodipicolinate reductase [Deltaproteobacteria bacterium]|nr:4-hydroxy-tetrahydrodipicolinate reductase [Deltaproteobacteria bacterium]
MAYKVVQWATGGVGMEALRGILRNPQLELVGTLVYSAEKDGQDAGVLCGLDRVGVAATRDREGILAMDADCVCYTPLTPDLDEVCRILESGKNVVTTAFLFYPRFLPAADLRRIEAACTRGHSAVHGTGINPGFVGDLLALVMSGMCRRIEHVHITERGNWSLYDSPELIFDLSRFGCEPQETALENHAYARFMSGLFLQSVGMVAQGIGTRLDDIRTLQELELAKAEFKVAGRMVRPGTVSGQRYRWQGLRDGRPVIEIEALWTIGPDYPAQWPKPSEGWTVTIEGDPSVRATFLAVATFDRSKKASVADHARGPTIATAMHAVNAIVPLCQAGPGVKTFLDLPVITGAHAGTTC